MVCHSSRVEQVSAGAAPDRAARRGVPRPAWRASTAASLVLREFTWVALSTQVVWILASPDLWPSRVALGSGGLVLSLSLVTWLILLGTQWWGTARQRALARVADVSMVGAAAVVLAFTADSAAEWDRAASLGVLCAALAGALLPQRVSVPVVVGAALVSLEPAFRFAGPEQISFATSESVYIAVLGGCVIGVRAVWERNARRIDDDTRTRDEIERSRMIVGGVEGALLRQERLLHETVLNTLTAIDRGGIAATPAMQQALDDRCREAIDVLRGLESGAQALGPEVEVSPTGFVSLGNDLVAYIDGLRGHGLEVEVVADSLEDVPEPVRGALGTAIREALANVARHAGAERVWILVRVRRTPRISLRVEVRDDGRGFDPFTARRRFGLDRAILGPMQEVGGAARVESRPDNGTRVVLEWSEGVAAAAERTWAARQGFALPGLATFWLFLAATTALAWLQFGHPPLSLADLALVAVLGVLIALAAPEAPLSWGLIVTVSLLGPMFALLGQTADDTLPFGGGWALAALAALFTTAGAIGPRWAWVPLTLSWLVVEADPAASLVQPATLLVLGGAFFGRSLRRDTARLERAHAQRLSAEAALDVTRESLARLRSRYGPLQSTAAIALLSGIVDGSLDPADPAVQRQAGIEESFIRTLMGVDPQADALRALTTYLAVVAHGRQILLKADLSLPAVPGVVVPPTVAGSLTAAVASTEQFGSARLTARTDGIDVVVTLLTPIAGGERERMEALPVAGAITDPDDPADPMMLWETRLSVADAG